jgi:hypothetical protein
MGNQSHPVHIQIIHYMNLRLRYYDGILVAEDLSQEIGYRIFIITTYTTTINANNATSL